jgi:hypothetical protein
MSLGNANPNYNENTPITTVIIGVTIRTAIKKQGNKCCRGCRKLEHLFIAGGNGKWHSHCGNSLWFLKKLNTK